MSDYKGKVMLIVNTATGCGFTPQYAGFQIYMIKIAIRALSS
jgi:glutathione peroxidase